MSNPIDSRLARLALVAFDVDGVFTDGRFTLSDDGIESKTFHTQDGFGVRQLLAAGVEVAVISGRGSRAVERRMQELGVRHVFLAAKDKVAALKGLLDQLGIPAEHAAFVGDDSPDLPAMNTAGLAIAVANAHRDVAAIADWRTTQSGGQGAVREVCDAILLAKNHSRDAKP